jgi:small subunit ribosomal protein S24e
MPAEQLEITIADEKKNKLLGRTELKVQVKHMGHATPTRHVLRAELGRVSKSPPERVFIRKIVTDYGAGISECIANVYATLEAGQAVESEYIRKRNAPPEEKKPEAPKEAPPTPEKAPTPAAPEEKAPAEKAATEKVTTEPKEKPGKQRAEPEEAATKSKAPKKKPEKESSEAKVEPAPEEKAP